MTSQGQALASWDAPVEAYTLQGGWGFSRPPIVPAAQAQLFYPRVASVQIDSSAFVPVSSVRQVSHAAELATLEWGERIMPKRMASIKPSSKTSSRRASKSYSAAAEYPPNGFSGQLCAIFSPQFVFGIILFFDIILLFCILIRHLFGERVMQELAESMTSPLAAAMVVSSGGAHLIASAVKQFKAHGSQKVSISKCKASKAASASKPAAGDKVEVKVPLQETAQSLCASIVTEPLHQQSNGDSIHLITIKDAKKDDVQHPQVVPTCNEARRKRQRTSDELLEFDDHKGDCHCKGSSEMYAVNSTPGETRAEMNLPVGAYLWRSASEFPSLCSSIQWDVNDCTGSSKGEAKCSKWVELVKNKTNHPKMSELDCLNVLEKEARGAKGEEISLVHAGSSQIGSDDVLISLSKKFGEVSRTLLEAMVDEVCDSRSSSCRSAELEASIMSRLQGMVTASVQSLPLGSTTQCKVLFTKQRDLANHSNRSAKVWCSTAREKTKGKSFSDVKVRKSSGLDEANEHLKGQKIQSSYSETACIMSPPADLHPCSRQHQSSDRDSKEKQENLRVLESRVSFNKGVDSKEEGMMRDDFNSCKVTTDGSLQEARQVAFPSVLNLAKEAGLPDVVATACHALDKLINAALQGKGAANNGVTASQLSGRRRGKVMPAELYVALTEALVEIVQVLKDQVDLLCWCLDCLGSILPPTTLNRPTHDGFASSACSAFDSFLSSKELLHANGCKGRKADSGAAGRQTSCEQSDSQTVKASGSASAGCVEMSFRSMPKSVSGASSSDAALLTGDNSSTGVIGSSLCSSISSGSAASSLSALAAVAYTATVPMLAEKAVKAILSAIQPCDIEPQSTQAALHALSAHLSSTNSKYVCDDVITFIIAAMREFKYDADMQTESCITLSALNRAISAATGHCAWSTILDNMNTHHTNVVVQRAGCSALHVLCTRAGLGVLEWGSGKRPERAGKDSDREAGVEVLVSAMLSFPDDVRIQWHGCSALWTLVDSAGTRSVVTMVDSGALRAVTRAMRVCRTNEIMQQEGCNMIGTMARLLVEGGYGFGSQPIVQASELRTSHKVDRHGDGNKCSKDIYRHGDEHKTLHKTKVHEVTQQGERFLGLSEQWWEALKVVVSAMRSFKKSKSVQSNGTFALGCILKGAMESIHTGSTPSSVPSFDLSVHRDEWSQKKLVSSSRACREQLGYRRSESTKFERGALEDIEQLNEAVEVTMVAMPEFPKVETIQVWGCAVLQQVFIAYVNYSKHIMLLSSAGSASCGSSQGGGLRKVVKQAAFCSDNLSHSSALANLVLSQATSTMFMISGMMALSYNGPAGNSDQQGIEKPSVFCDSRVLTKSGTGKSMGLRPQSAQTNQALTSVRQSWCAALGAIGDVFGHLTQSTEVSVGKNLPKIANGFDIKAASTGATESSSKEIPFVSGKVAPMTAIKRLETEHFDRKVGVPAGDCSPPSYILPNSQGVKSKCFTPGANSLVNLPSCKPVRVEDNFSKSKPGKRSSRALTKSDATEQVFSQSEWGAKGDFCQQQVIEDIKAWQEATESLAKIAEMVGFPMSVKNAILAIRTILYKLEDAETVIWACHALVGLYLTWENVHLFKPGLECDREEFKAKIWGEGDVGVRQLVYLVSHWTKQNRMDVVTLALQALYRACVFAATVREIEEVFTPSDCGIEAVLDAILKVLGSGGSLFQRKKVVQQACCVLTEVCGYSIPAQIAFAAAGGADIILAAMERFDEDNEVLFNGLHALGLDSRSQVDFNVLWNAALHRNNLGNGGKKGSKKKGAAYSFVSFSHVFKEGTSVSIPTRVPTDGKAIVEEVSYESEYRGFRISSQLERLIFDENSQMGRFVTWLIVGPGCGGPSFCADVLRRLNLLSPKQSEMQSHVCLVIGHMSLRNIKWCQDFLESGGLEAVLACLEGICPSRAKRVLSLPVCVDGVKETLQFDLPQHDTRSAVGRTKLVSRSKHSDSSERGVACVENSHLHYAACIALTGIMRDQKAINPLSVNVVIKALVLALHHYGGLSHLDLYIARVQGVQAEVCAAARLALARLGVSWVGDSRSKQLAHEAAEVGDLISLEALSKKHVDIMALDGSGRAPFWYAEQSGQFKVVEYLKEQEQSVGKRRAREKSKSKGRRSASKGDPQSVNVRSAVQDFCSSDASREQLELPQTAAVEDPDIRLQVLQERNSRLTLSGTADQSAKETLNTTHAKENFNVDADCSMPCVVGQDTEISRGALKKEHDSLLPPTKEINPLEAERKVTRRKKTRGKKSQANQQFSGQDIAAKSGMQSPLTVSENVVDDSQVHAVEQVLVVLKKESCNEVVSESLADSDEIRIDKSTCEGSPNLTVLSAGEKSPGDIATCENHDQSKHANKLLQDALVSGVVENLEAAIRTCTAPESGADDTLLKKVRAALAKRLKRVEKSAQLEKELSAAVQEGSSSRLLAAIVAIENVPRFAAASSEKITEARSVLLEIQKKEILAVKEEALKKVMSGSDIEAASMPLECEKDTGDAAGEPRLVKAGKVRGNKCTESVLGSKTEPSEAQIKENRKGWQKIDIEGHSNTTFKREDNDVHRSLIEGDLVNSGCQKERGEGQTLKVLLQPLMKVQDSSVFTGSKSGRVLPDAVLRLSGNTHATEERPPLLPTPPAYTATPLLSDHVARSVIQPPRHRDQPALLLERTPITPQLFHTAKGAPYGHSYREVLEGKDDVSEGCSSLKDFGSEINELGPSHISQLFPPCSSPQLFSANSDPLCYNSWSSGYSEQGGSVFKPGPSLTNIESTHLSGDFVPSSTTLFSSAYGESDQFLSGSGFAGSHFSVALPSHHRPVHLQASESNGSSLPAFVQQALSCTCDDDDDGQVKSVNSASWMNSSALCFPEELQGNSNAVKHYESFGSHPEPLLFKEKTRQLRFLNQDFQHLSQVHLQQSGILDTSLGVSCSVCLDNPKDATLISCGHQLCKGCAEQMHRLHHHCPVCNRMIETVLSLCS
ncbi:hypothetical protein GOP47_0016854 [Adiantum capillus-veneris]|uniref:RING-type domain-containing protein n=1 Tax=Adiantum capillus-veneris TaxID=13818 RepID=A0A9D4UIH1_ADICA|nr:hypothetical protein GOP47_0016854 [Adiantum capillus-veneris]